MEENEISKLSFEEAIKDLQKIVEQLENGNVELEKSIELYEKGAKLRIHCENKLKVAEKKISKISLEKDGEVSVIDSEQRTGIGTGKF